MAHDDLSWLVAERPEPIELDRATTERARRELLDHALGRDRGRAGSHRPRAAARLFSWRGVTAPLGLALIIIAAVAVLITVSPARTNGMVPYLTRILES